MSTMKYNTTANADAIPTHTHSNDHTHSHSHNSYHHQVQAQVQAQVQVTPPLSQSSELNDAVEKILLNVESRQDILGVHAHVHSHVHAQQVGKLSIGELEQLSLLASNANHNTTVSVNVKIDSNSNLIAHDTSSTTARNSMNNNTNNSSSRNDANFNFKSGWSLVNVESLCELCSLLEEHIRNASRVDFIKYAREAFDEIQEGGENGNGNANSSRESLDQVSYI
jgi:hypothetical protein